MDGVRVAEFPLSMDLSPIRLVLEQHHIEYRIDREDGSQILYVDSDAHVGEVVTLLRESIREMERRQEQVGLRASPDLSRQFARTPVMMICLGLSIVGALIPHWWPQLLHWLTFQDFTLVSNTRITFGSLQDSLAAGQYWRLITPIFLHFGVFHIVFNGLWLWEFGRRIETLAGSLHFLLLVLVTGLVSNGAQYWWSGPSLFGGMSGVIFGLLGYLWIRNLVAPHPGLTLPRGIVPLMIGWLLICMTGLIDFFFAGSIANAAHAAGLATGALLGAAFGLAARGR